MKLLRLLPVSPAFVVACLSRTGGGAKRGWGGSGSIPRDERENIAVDQGAGR